MSVVSIRLKKSKSQFINERGDYVLYWMIATRRLHFNLALDRALAYCASPDKPLIIFEALRIDYRWASDRLHRFALDGMADNRRLCEERDVRYYF